MSGKRYQAVVIGVSAGGPDVLHSILSALPAYFPVPIIIVQHTSPHSENYIVVYLDNVSALSVKEAEEKKVIMPGNIYFAPPNYHLLIETDFTFSFSVEAKVNFSRPSVDVLFDTAVDAYGKALIGIILTGANKDGSMGLNKIKTAGGLTIVQSPDTALARAMPEAAIAGTAVDHILPPDGIGSFLCQLFGESNECR